MPSLYDVVLPLVLLIVVDCTMLCNTELCSLSVSLFQMILFSVTVLVRCEYAPVYLHACVPRQPA